MRHQLDRRGKWKAERGEVLGQRDRMDKESRVFCDMLHAFIALAADDNGSDHTAKVRIQCDGVEESDDHAWCHVFIIHSSIQLALCKAIQVRTTA